MWMTESSQCYMTHWVVLRNWSSQLSPHQVGCKLEVWGKGTCESSQELQLQQETFLGNVCAEAEEQKLEEGTPEKSLSGLDCAFRKNAVKKKIGTMSKETAYFFVYMLNSLVFKEEFSVLCKKVCIKAPSISFFFFSFFFSPHTLSALLLKNEDICKKHQMNYAVSHTIAQLIPGAWISSRSFTYYN